MARILVADDESAIREVIRAACGMDRHEVLAVATTEEAIDGYANFLPDLMILDVSMPGGGAERILADVARTHGSVACPVLVVSGYAAQDLDALPVAEVIQKPFNIDDLRIAVQKALGAA